MNALHFSDNLIQLRHQKRLTQEQLADYMGVTKASVSKWETGQSLPDIYLLPLLASFFDVSIDELLGYEPQLSKEQIQKLYHCLAADFASQPFDEVMKKSEDYVRKYYSCYPFLFQVCVLWLNHFMLAQQNAQTEILTKISDLLVHILDSCKDIDICSDSIILKASVDLQLGKPQKVIEELKDILDPRRLSAQSDHILIQSYQMAGESEQASSLTQISMYNHLLGLFACAVQYLNIRSNELSVCEETISRLEQVAATYRLDSLHPNTMANFYYQAALVYCQHEKTDEALGMLKRYVENVRSLLSGFETVLRGDDYFDQIDTWFESLDLGTEAPRNKQTVAASLPQTLSHPAFAVLADKEEFAKIRKLLLDE